MGRFIGISRRWLRRAGIVFLLVAILAIGAFGLLQTPIGQSWAGDALMAAISGPGASVSLDGLGGVIPFHMTAKRIAMADPQGVWLALDDIEFDLSPSELLAGRAHIRVLAAGRTEVSRWPASSGESLPLSERLRIPHLPFPVQIDRFAIERLILEPATLGERVEASLTGTASVNGSTLLSNLDLHRSDGLPGAIQFRLGLSGEPAVLSVRLAAMEPTGAVLEHLLQRNDPLPLSLSLTGEGPLTGWDGILQLSAGSLARFGGKLSISGGSDTDVTFSGLANVDRLLPPDIAPLVGEDVPMEARARVMKDGAISVDKLAIEMAAGRLTGGAVFANPDRTISGHLEAALPRLSVISGTSGSTLAGSADLRATISGTEDQPQLKLVASGENIALSAGGAEHAEAWLTVGAAASHGVDIIAQGEVHGIMLPDPARLPATPNRDFSWSLAAQAKPDSRIVEVKQFAARGLGLDLTGSGTINQPEGKLEGHITLSLDDLVPFSSFIGRRLEGAAAITAVARRERGETAVTIDGSLSRLRTGIPAVDAVTGGSVAINGSGVREQSGTIDVKMLRLNGAAGSLETSGAFDPDTRRVSATLDGDFRELAPIGAAIHAPLAGHLKARISADGPIEKPHLQARIEGNGVAAGPALFERLQLEGTIADLAEPQLAVTGAFRARDVDGTLSLKAEYSNGPNVAIKGLRVKAAEALIGGDLGINFDDGLIRGSLAANIPDLSRWSRLADIALAGKVEAKATLAAGRGQAVDVSISGDRLAAGAGNARFTIGEVGLKARFADLLNAPTGQAQIKLANAHFRSAGLTSASLDLDGSRAGRFGFSVMANGQLVDPLSAALSGEVQIAPERSRLDVRVTRLTGSLGKDRFQLSRPLQLSKHGADLALSDLALTLGQGEITGSAALRGQVLSLQAAGRDVPIAPAARNVGYPDLSGTLTLDANLGGTVAAPHGRFSLSGRSLRLSAAKQPKPPPLGIEARGDWNGRTLALDGNLSGTGSETIRFDGSAPLVLHGSSLSVPAGGPLALRAEGSGELANLADLLPIGEDKLKGHYVLDLSVHGTPANPSAEGSFKISNGRYENFSTGASLSNIALDVAGDRDRLNVLAFSAKDSTDKGTLRAQGSIALSGTGPTADLSATLDHFRIAARDAAVATASGALAISGALASPTVRARLAIEDGEFTIPSQLPPSVARLEVVETKHRADRQPAPAADSQRPAIPATLEIDLAVPGRVFVRGRGLDSEWGGRVKISGTSASPRMAGSLELRRGTFDVLGKSFKITRGLIRFDGGASLDPVLDVTAELAAGDVTAQVFVTGLSSNPSIRFGSTPVLPQDEILARVLFNRGLGQITPAEGIQVAQAAAALAGGGPGVLDRLRGRLGLDRLLFGSAPTGVATSSLNPAAGGSSTSGAAISGGKYVAEGVYVGATQGLTPQSGKVTVEIEIRPHVTVETDLSQTSGNGIGLNYKYDY